MGDSAVEVWFRGEGVGVAPSSVGGHEHDFGDGVYYTDKEDIAAVYASRRAPTAADQRVWMVNVERSSMGRVLDLSTDARWNSFMTSTKDPMLMGRSRLDFLKIKQELYGQYFREFLKLNKIEIRGYDAVIGPEYNLGGRQLCILHRNGQSSSLALRFTGLRRPATAVVRWTVNTSAGKEVLPIKINPKVNSRWTSARRIGGTAAVIGVSIILNYLGNKLIGHIHEGIIRDAIKGFEPEIQKRIANQKRRALELLADGKKAYAVVTYIITYYYTLDPDPVGGGWDQSAPGVKLDSVQIGSTEMNGSWETKTDTNFGQRVERTPYAFSAELSVDKEDVESYVAARDEIKWYENALKNENLNQQDKDRLTKEKKILDDKMQELFGN